MKVKLIDTTNNNFKILIGNQFYFKQFRTCICLEPVIKPGKGIKTSQIISVNKTEDRIYLETQNSYYELEILGDKS